MWKNKWKVILPVALVVILAFAFWYGNGTPESRGWTAEPVTAEMQKPTADEREDLSPETEDGEESDSTGTEEQEPAQETQKEPAVSSDTAPNTGKDKYHTDPVPEGKPDPVEPNDTTVTDTALTCTLSISCATILDHLDTFGKAELVPEDGWILRPTKVTFYEGESVFNVLQRICKQKGIHLEFMSTPMYNSVYIEGVFNLYEFDVGDLSGWMYKVNGWFPNYGCSRYQLSDRDTVEWVYTCDLGFDIGGDGTVGWQGREDEAA